MVEGVRSGAGDVAGGRGGERDQALLWESGMREGEILVTVRDRRDDSRWLVPFLLFIH